MRILFAALVLLAGCQSPWARYDASLYQTVANPSEDSYAFHVSTLEEMVRLDPVPPGMCAELAYYLILAGRTEEAGVWLDREVETYPQSAKFVSELRAALGLDQPASR